MDVQNYFCANTLPIRGLSNDVVVVFYVATASPGRWLHFGKAYYFNLRCRTILEGPIINDNVNTTHAKRLVLNITSGKTQLSSQGSTNGTSFTPNTSVYIYSMCNIKTLSVETTPRCSTPQEHSIPTVCDKRFLCTQHFPSSTCVLPANFMEIMVCNVITCGSCHVKFSESHYDNLHTIRLCAISRW